MARFDLVQPLLEAEAAVIGECSVILFGSYAKGTARPASDIDIAIRASGPLPLALWSRLEEACEESDLAQKVDIVDYYRVLPPFRAIIDTTGRPLIRV